MSPVPYGCAHNLIGKPCHNMWFTACPNHFSAHTAQALRHAIGTGDNVVPFYAELQHLVLDRYLTPAYYTWAAMIGRYTERGEDLRVGILDDGRVTPGGQMPGHAVRVARHVEMTCRAAAAQDPANLDAALEAIADQGETDQTVSFMMSIAASAGLTVNFADACTSEHITAYLLLGSQIQNGWGSVVLPYLVDLVMLHGDIAANRRSPEELPGLVRTLIDSAPTIHPLPVATDIVCRTLAQTVDIDALVVDQATMTVLDIDRASPENTERAMMAMVWAVRASRAYARAQTAEQGNLALREVVRQRGDGLSFAVDVIAAGTQMIANNIVMPEPSGSPG